MKPSPPARKRGFSLIETVIAIGVLAVLLTGFMIVFAPAAAGVRKAINVQEADRLATTLEQELVTFRTGDQTFSAFEEPAAFTSGFDKAFHWVRNSYTKKSNPEKVALLIYQYRGSLSSVRTDGTPEPVKTVANQMPGKDYAVRTMVRRKSDPKFLEDMDAIEGSVYVVKCTQLIFSGGELKPGTAGQIVDPKTPTGELKISDTYPEAVIAFSAEFFALPSRSKTYIEGAAFAAKFPNLKTPVFTRNLAVRR
jgi:prepilin-type N-terminal cleavage/methylation domain-containing protein